MSAIKKIEETYLNLFKIVLLLILTVALFAAIGLAIKGWLDSRAEPAAVAPAEVAPPPKVDFEDFIKSLEQSEEPAPEPAPATPNEPSTSPAQPPVDPLEQMVDKYINSAWEAYNTYQTGCMVENPQDRASFVGWEPLRNFFRGNFEDFGEAFARSQDEFFKAVLPDPRVIEACVRAQGRGRIFVKSVEWHHKQWVAALKASNEYDRRELSREEAERSLARLEAAATRASGQQMLWAALIAFGVFMSLALLLIFSKIESNLRVRHEKEAQSETPNETTT